MFRISKIPIIESNSQLIDRGTDTFFGCFVYQRYQLLKAIHNIPLQIRFLDMVVSYIKDTNYWKQFTTQFPEYFQNLLLFRISKIPIIESNSQRYFLLIDWIASCFVYQRYQLLKAIHNFSNNTEKLLRVVSYIKDTNYWKQFTTLDRSGQSNRKLFRISKIPIIESNSQHDKENDKYVLGCFVYQRYQLLKAIHNWNWKLTLTTFVVSYIKDTNYWKQFTTCCAVEIEFDGCFVYQRYQLLKAIHNYFCVNFNLSQVVSYIKDTNYWKQFTTR